MTHEISQSKNASNFVLPLNKLLDFLAHCVVLSLFEDLFNVTQKSLNRSVAATLDLLQLN